MRGSVKCDFQVEDQGGSATPVPVKDHSVDLPSEHVHERAQAHGDRGGVREESEPRRMSSPAHFSCAAARPSLVVFFVC